MSDYKVRVGVLAGGNRGDALKAERMEKERMGKKMKTRYLSGRDKLYMPVHNPDTTVLGATIDSLINCDRIDVDNSIVTCDLPMAEATNSLGKMPAQDQTGNCLYDTMTQCVNTLYADGYKGHSLIICGDVPALRPEDITKFIDDSLEANVNGTFSLVNMDEARMFYNSHSDIHSSGRLVKGTARMVNDGHLESGIRPATHYGNAYLIDCEFFDKYKKLEPAMQSILGKKKIVNNPDNFGFLANVLKDEDKEIKNNPSNLFSFLYTLSTTSSLGKRLAFNNWIMGARNLEKSVTFSEVENFVADKLFDNIVSMKIVEAPYRFAFDADTKPDRNIIDAIRKFDSN